jgi:hypothetical protein
LHFLLFDGDLFVTLDHLHFDFFLPDLLLLLGNLQLIGEFGFGFLHLQVALLN